MRTASSAGLENTGEIARALKIWIFVCAVVGAGFFISQLAEIPSRSALRGYDNTFNYLWLRSAMVDGDWDFRNDIAQCDTLAPDHQASALTLPLTPVGRLPNKYGVGWALVSTPFYFVADGIVAAGRGLGWWELRRDGFNPVYQVCLQTGHLGLALLALWLAMQTLAAWLADKESALVGVVTVWAAGPLSYYQTVNLSMSHGVAFLAIAAMAYALMRAQFSPEKSGLGWWLVAGAAWGLATVTRFQLAVFGIVAAVALTEARRERPAGGRGGLGFALGAAPLIALQLWAWHVVYGRWVVFGYGAEGESFHWARPAVLRSLFSPWHGLFYWHPFLLLAMAGMAGWAWRQREQAAGWALAFGATAYVSAAWWCWWFASAFGNRSYDAALLPLMAGVAWLWRTSSKRARRALCWIAIVAGLWNFYVAALYRTGAISRHEPVTWLEMISAARRLPSSVQF